MQYPPSLTPTDEEPFALPGGETVFIPKSTPAFARWDGPRPSGLYGRKPCIDFQGELVYAEIAILRVLQAGWDGVWV